MSKLPVLKQKINAMGITRFVPYAIGLVVLIVGFMGLRSGLGLVGPASAQVNVQRVGEAAAEQATGAPRSSLEQAGEAATAAPAEGENPAGGEVSAGGAGELVLNEPANVPGETAAPADQTPAVVYETGPGTRFYVSEAGVGGVDIRDTDVPTLRSFFGQMELIAVQPEPIRNSLIELGTSIMSRFQAMVSPPWDPKWLQAGETPPWLADTHRYSPFDPVGGGGPTAGPTKPVPPFPPLERTGGARQVEITAVQIAAGIELRGVLGEPGNYRAILRSGSTELNLGVGEDLVTIGDTTFVVTEVNLGSVRIASDKRPSDQALIQFVSRAGIADISISY